MAESMEKPPPYSPPHMDPYQDGQENKMGPSPVGYAPHPGRPVPPPNFVPPAYQQGMPPSGYPGPQYQTSQPMGQNFPNYGSTVYVHQPPPATQVIVVGGCPACRIGVLEDDFTCLGLCLAIMCFPIGILCCLAMRQRRCPNCGAIFG